MNKQHAQSVSSVILVVDDDMMSRTLMHEALEQVGFEVIEAENGRDALDKFSQFNPAIVLMDVEMPEMDGYAACAALRKLPGGEHVPVIMVTGLDDIQSVNKAYEAGATDFITKPINWTILGHRVRYILRASTAFNELKESETRLANAQRMAGLGDWVWDIRSDKLYWSDEVYRIFGLQPQEIPATYEMFLDRVHPGDRATVRRGVEESLAKDQPYSVDHRIVLPSGEERLVHEQAEVTIDTDGQPARMPGTVQDITERRRIENRQARLGRILNSSYNEIYIFDAQTLRFIEVNEGACRNLGYVMDELREMTAVDLKPDFTQEQFAAVLGPLRNGTKDQIYFETEHRRKDGSRYPVEVRLQLSHMEDPPVFTAIIQDTSERKKAQERIRHLAYYDALTDLPNRQLYVERLEQALNYARRHNKQVATLYVDLDRFKRINDTLGHSAGDALLKEVAQRLQQCVRSTDSVGRAAWEDSVVDVSRFGGDEFTLLLTELDRAESAALVARRILRALERPFQVEGHELLLTPSIGIAVYPTDGEDSETLLKNADTAMYHAKEEGRNNYQYYTASMNTRSLERLSLESQLKKAVEREELFLLYQPKVDVATWQVVGAEVLLRWRHPEMGLVSPAQFIPLAEETGLIVPIGEWVMEKACQQNRAWQTAGINPINIAVNLSSQQFRHGDLSATLNRVLRQSGMEPRHLELELTESIIMEDSKVTIDLLHEFKELGVSWSLDDFGTGYSSLSYLKRFPLDTLKIDRSFVRDIHTDPDDAAITTAIIAMAHNLNLKVVAEGVETEEQLAFLRDHACDEIQGFLFSRPIPAEDLAQLLTEPVAEPAAS